MARSPKSRRTVSIQVKTATNATPKGKEGILYWRLSSKAPELRKGAFYAFVDMKGCTRPEEAPDVFIVPGEWVADPKHRNIPNAARALASVNVYPKDKDKKPSSFWFDLYSKGQHEWKENWKQLD